jgi:hypothetical protein
VDGVDLEARGCDQAPQPRDMDVEHVAVLGLAVGPTATQERLAADDRVRALEKRCCEPCLDRREHDDVAVDPQRTLLEREGAGVLAGACPQRLEADPNLFFVIV